MELLIIKELQKAIIGAGLTLASLTAGAQTFELNQSGYFNCEGVDVMAFSDFYPEGHQGGISRVSTP